MWSSSAFDLATDLIGYFEGELLVAFALMDDRRHVMAEVRPSYAARGLGTVLPEDVTIGRFDEVDAPAIHRVITDAFAEWQTVPPGSYEDWRVVNIEREGADTDYFRVARSGGEIVGVAIVHDSGGATWVPQLAVRADRRRQGMAQELLAEAFEAGRQRGCATGELSTSALTGALGLYQGLGMRIVAEFHTWEKAY